MLFRIVIVLLSLVLSIDAAAQRVAPAQIVDAKRPLFDRMLSVEVSSPLSGTSSQVVPLWASPDGRLLAIVAMSKDAGAPTLPPSPAFGGVSDLRVVDATDLFSAGLRLRIGQDMRADLTLGQLASPVSYGTSPQFGCAFEACTAGQAFAGNNSSLSARIGFGWSPAVSENVDFSFGLSWLDGGANQLPVLAQSLSTSSPIDLGLLDLPGIANYRLDSARRLSARGSWQSSQGSVVDLTAALGSVQLSPIWYGLSGSGLDLNQASLGLGLSSGSLRGSIVGRINSLDEPGVIGSQRWSGLDLGVSWRTPWRGEVTVGAQNLWSAPLDAATSHDVDASKARTPYVQYRQDL